MTEGMITADPIAWKHALARFKTAKAECESSGPPSDRNSRNPSLDRYCQAEAQLLHLPAPDIEAVIAKLMVLWDHIIARKCEPPAPELKVIGDLRRVQMINGLY